MIAIKVEEIAKNPKKEDDKIVGANEKKDKEFFFKHRKRGKKKDKFSSKRISEK